MTPTPPDPAWDLTGLNDEAVTYLRRRGHHPDLDRMPALLTSARMRTPDGPGHDTRAHRHAALTYAHPHLTPGDITLLLDAGLTLPETDRHITESGLTGRDILTVLAGLQ